jgi:histone H3/H4
MDFEYDEAKQYFDKKRKLTKKHAYNPETMALRSIRMIQKATDLVLPQREFQEFVKKISKDFCSDMMFTQIAYFILQEAIEMKFIKWAQASLHISLLIRKSKFLDKEDFVNVLLIK